MYGACMYVLLTTRACRPLIIDIYFLAEIHHHISRVAIICFQSSAHKMAYLKQIKESWKK